MSKTDKELFDALSKGDELNADDGATIETEFEVIPEAEPENEPEPVEEEEAEAQETEAEAEAETDEGEPEPDAEDKPTGVQIPKAQYDRIRGKQKEAEALADQRAQENAALQGRLEQIERLLSAQAQPQAQQPQEPVEPPDPVTDPEGFAALIDARINQQVQAVETRFIQGSLDRARDTYGDEYEKAAAFMNQNGTPELADAIRKTGDPGAQIVRYYRRQVALSEVGDDPAAYREKTKAAVRAEMLSDPAIREELLTELRSGATTRKADGSPAIKTAPSLARGSRAADARPQTNDPIEGMSDEAIFAKLSRTG